MGEGEGEQFIAKLEPRCGIGLGIAVMVRVVGWHGGRVTFGNGEERGAWTQFVLPLPSAAQPEVRDTLQTSAREPLFSY
jgi:K+-sensing histidine kinase KdpD